MGATVIRNIAKPATAWPFILSLCVLLVNDLWLKADFPGVVTGKVSDFAGIFLVGLALFAWAPRRAVLIGAVMSVTFVWWKSAGSDGLIQYLHALGLSGFGRVVDLSDTVALGILPLAHAVARRIDEYQLTSAALRRWVRVPVLGATFVAIVGTSVMPLHDRFDVRATGTEDVDRDLVAGTIRAVAEKHGLSCARCDRPTEAAEYLGDSISMRYEIKAGRTILFHVIAIPALPLFSRVPARVETLRRDVTRALGSKIDDLELVFPLSGSAR